MKIFSEGLARNREIKKIPPSEFYSISGDWRKLGIPSFAQISPVNVTKCQDYNFYRFWAIKGKPTGGKSTPCHADTHTDTHIHTHTHTHSQRLRLIKCFVDMSFKVCNNWKSFHNDIEKIKSNLIKKAYRNS